jgi:hypothetical protein
MPKGKWFGLDQKTMDLWDQIDDKYKSVILGYNKPSSPSTFSSKPSGKPPFPTKPRHNINLLEMSAYEFLQVHSHELEPDPEPGEAIHEDASTKEVESEPSDTLLINAVKGSRPSPLPPGDIRRVVSKNSKRSVSLAHIVLMMVSQAQMSISFSKLDGLLT